MDKLTELRESETFRRASEKLRLWWRRPFLSLGELSALEEERTLLEELAMQDSLTGAFNRRYFDSALEGVSTTSCHRNYAFDGRAVAVGILDLDYFKNINDQYGHVVGDAVLRGFSRFMRDSLRMGTTFARYGGEEFSILVPDVKNPAGLVAHLETLISQYGAESPEILRAARDELPDPSARMSFSAGIAIVEPEETGGGAAWRADEQLYAAKDAGRACVCLAPLSGNLEARLSARPAGLDTLSYDPACRAAS